MRLVGTDGKHLKLKLKTQNSNVKTFDGIAFNMGEKAKGFHIEDIVDVAYVIDEDQWNGNARLQLKIKDIVGVDS